MTTYTDVFGNSTLPPSEYGYSVITNPDLLALVQLDWPYLDSTPFPVSKIMDLQFTAGAEIRLPDCSKVSTGEDILFRNTSGTVLTVSDYAGNSVVVMDPGAAYYLYLMENATAAGVWGVIAFGVGTSSVDAYTLRGYGIKAIGATLNTAHPAEYFSISTNVDSTYRAKLLIFTGGVGEVIMNLPGDLGDDFYFLLRNNGTGTLSISASSIDSQTSIALQPSESAMILCTGTEFVTVGIGRSTLYQFSQLVKDISSAGTIALTPAEAGNKLLTFVGNPATDVIIEVPSVVSVYYLYCNISTAVSVTVQTSGGSGAAFTAGNRLIVICDGTSVFSANTGNSNSTQSLVDGSANAPSLYFATKTNTGLFKSGTGLGITAVGTKIAEFLTSGLVMAKQLLGIAGSVTIPGVAVGNASTGWFYGSSQLAATVNGVKSFAVGEGFSSIGQNAGNSAVFFYQYGTSVAAQSQAYGSYNRITFTTNGVNQTDIRVYQSSPAILDDGVARTISNVYGATYVAPDVSGMHASSVITDYDVVSAQVVSDPRFTTVRAFRSNLNKVVGKARWAYFGAGDAPSFHNGDIIMSANRYDFQPTPTTIGTGTAVTLTIAGLLTKIINGAPATAATYTLPTGVLIEPGIGDAAITGASFDWVIQNIGTSTILLAASAGHTISPAPTTIAAGAFATYRTRRTAANTYITYRIA